METNLDIGTPAAWWRWLRQWRHNQLVQACDRVAVLDNVHDNGKLGPRYAFMIVMACGIATLGLLQNSAAVIIGAMLISPLMGPIVELGMGLATFDLRSIRGALKTLAAGVLLALAIAMLIVWMSPLKEATSEILARTQPTFFDLLVAVFSGLAGAYATVTRKGETIVGVAIATALMPPLAVVGFGIAVANWNIAGGAAFLFMTNLLAIALSVTIVARLYGFGGSDSPKQTAWQASVIIGSFVLLSIPLVLALQRIASQSRTELAVRTTLDASAAQVGGRVTGLRVEPVADGVSVDAVVMASRHVPGLETRVREALLRKSVPLAALRVREVVTEDDASIASEQDTLAQLRNSVSALQDAESVRMAQQRARADQQAGMQASLLPWLGKLQRSADGARWELWLAPSTLGLARAQQMETQVNTQRGEGQLPVDVYPALQSLPAIPLASGDGEPATAAALSAQAWALQRWRATAVQVVVVSPDDEAAAAWEAKLRDALSARGIALASLQRERKGDPQLQLALGPTP